jgi:N-terminal half of MaoC dehydratase
VSTPATTAAAADRTHISEQMKAAVGSLLSRKVSYPVSESDIRRWAIAAYYPEPPPARFMAADAAAETHDGVLVAPEELNPFAWAVAEDDSAEKSSEGSEAGAAGDPNRLERVLGIVPPAIQFQLNGGLEVDYLTPIRPGDVITAESRLLGYRERAGRLGLMLFTTTEDTWTNQRGEIVKRSRMTGIRY